MKVHVKGKTEFDRFQNLLKAVLTVPHSEIKAKLDAEKKAKKRKKARASASGRASKSSR
jgi:hypothetical protein